MINPLSNYSKAIAGGVGAALATILIFLAETYWMVLPEAVQAAVTVLVTAAVVYASPANVEPFKIQPVDDQADD